MPIVIDRKTGAAKATEISREQNEILWETILRAYVRRHPEVLRDEEEEK